MPPLTPPNQATALANTNAAEAAVVAAANTAFIQAITVFIDDAIPLGTIFSVSPPIPTNVDYNVISTYFTGLGYTVTLVLEPTPFFGFGLPAIGFPEVGLPNFPSWDPASPPPAYPSSGWTSWQEYVQRHHPLMMITWGMAP